ncbi:IQ domain-containing protein G [Biomphalaria pfeifferi]|uniref:IQ domain-containing protein G n=1 Tax=Biomphalaria pfeifferi TaxID=112525 RepID=A0AAD8CAJ6_BIOPF|nr:IQ domain-containing protein G [Biomphalaria pfeifferi]
MNQDAYSTASDELFQDPILKNMRQEMLVYLPGALEKKHPRDDYQEFLRLSFWFLGGHKDKEKFRAPGPTHHARWMAKAIYALKIFLFKTQFKLTVRESQNITHLALFVSLVYVKQWNEAPLAIRAPLNDIEFLSNLKTYPNKTVASKAHEAFSRHLWFLSEHLVGIALLDDRVSASIKEKMVQNLLRPALADIPRRVKLTSESEQLKLEDLVTERTTSFFDVLMEEGKEKSQTFLKKPPGQWTSDPVFKKFYELAAHMTVVNDVAERGISLIEKYNDTLTKNEEQKQFILRLVANHRRNFPTPSKTSLIVTCLDAINLAAIFEDLNDQLNVLANSIEAPYVDVRSRMSMFDQRTQSLFRLSPKASSDREFFLSLSIKYGCHFDTCIPKKILDMSIAQTEDSVKPGTSSSVVDKAVRATNITEAVLRQKDLYFIQQAAHDLIEDLVQRSSFSSLKEHFDKERRRREAVLNKLNLPNDLNLKINRLRKSLATLKDTQRKESCRLNNLIYHFRNEILEVKERTRKEAKFMEKTANMKIGKNRKYWQQQAAECDQTRESLLEEIDHEMNRNCSMVEIIHTKIASVKELLAYWTDKYETERDILIAELDILKEDRQKDLYRLEELNILTSQYMPIVEDFRQV